MTPSTRFLAVASYLLASGWMTAQTLQVYLPLDGNTDAGATTTYNGTVIGTNASPEDNYLSGKFGQAASFANTNTTATTPTDWAVSLGNIDSLYSASFTISVWLQAATNNYTADKAVLGNKNWASGANIGWTVSTIATNTTSGRVNWNSSGAGNGRKDPALAFNTTSWNHVVIVFDREANQVHRYLNGALVGTTTAAFGDSGAGSLGAGLATLIGASGNGSYGANSMRVDDFAIFSGKLNDVQIDYLYDDGQGRTADQLANLPNPKSITWTGAAGIDWSTATLDPPKNWALTDNAAETADFADGDTVTFDDSATNFFVDLSSGDVNPALTTFQPQTQSYLLTGTSGLTGTGNLVVNGTGSVELANPNAHTGLTRLLAGNLVVSHPFALRNSTLEGNLETSTHTFGAVTEATLGGLSGNAGFLLENGSAAPVHLLVGNSDTTSTYHGSLGGAGSLTKIGTGRFALGGANTHSGGTTASAGILALQNVDAAGSGLLQSTGGVIDFALSSGTEVTFPNEISLPSTGSGSIRMFGVFNPNGVAPTPGTAVRLTGKITGGTSDRVFRMSDTGITAEHDNTLILDSDANDFLGTVWLERASLAITSDAALGNPENDIVHFSENLNGRFRFDADGIVLNPLRAVSLPTSGTVRPFDTGGFTATIAGPISGPGTLVKLGSGTLVLSSQDSSHVGPITLSAGILRIDGIIGASPNAITAAADTTLTGSGSLVRPVTLNGATLEPGGIAEVGTLTEIAGLAVNAGSKLVIDISDWTGSPATGYDSLATPAVTLAATTEVPFTIVLKPHDLANFDGSPRTFTVISSTAISGFSADAVVVDASALPESEITWSAVVENHELKVVGSIPGGSPFETWIAAQGLSGADADVNADPDHDGLANVIEFLIGSSPNPAQPGAQTRQAVIQPEDQGDRWILRFSRRIDRGALQPGIEYQAALHDNWIAAIDGEDGISISDAPESRPGFETVTVSLPKSLGPQGRLFARLSVAP